MFIHMRAIDPDAKQAALLDAATELFAERTYAGTAVPLVAQRAGIALGTVYRFFPSKQALANSVYQRAKSALAASAIPNNAAVSVEDEFRGWWAGLLAFARDQPAALSFLETQDHEQYLDEKSRAVASALDRAAATFVRRAQTEGAMRAGAPEVIVAMVFGAFVGLHKLEEERGRTLTSQQHRLAADAAWALVAADRTPHPQPTRHRRSSRTQRSDRIS